MKKTILRSLSIFLAIFFILGTIPIGASAAETTFQKYEYQIYSDKEIILKYYLSDEENVVIPSEYDGYTVLGVGKYCFNLRNDRRIIPQTIHITKGISELYVNNNEYFVFDGLENLKYISVDKENMSFSDIDGVLMDKSANRLICIPQNTDIVDYSVPYSVNILGVDSKFEEKCNSLPFQDGNWVFPGYLWGEVLLSFLLPGV